MTCGTCGHWGGNPTRASYAFCYAAKARAPLWTQPLYPSLVGPKVLDQSPRMPFNDGAGCPTWKQTKRGGAK